MSKEQPRAWPTPGGNSGGSGSLHFGSSGIGWQRVAASGRTPAAGPEVSPLATESTVVSEWFDMVEDQATIKRVLELCAAAVQPLTAFVGTQMTAPAAQPSAP